MGGGGGSQQSYQPIEPMVEQEEIVPKKKARTGKKTKTILTGARGIEDEATIGGTTLLGA